MQQKITKILTYEQLREQWKRNTCQQVFPSSLFQISFSLPKVFKWLCDVYHI